MSHVDAPTPDSTRPNQHCTAHVLLSFLSLDVRCNETELFSTRFLCGHLSLVLVDMGLMFVFAHLALDCPQLSEAREPSQVRVAEIAKYLFFTLLKSLPLWVQHKSEAASRVHVSCQLFMSQAFTIRRKAANNHQFQRHPKQQPNSVHLCHKP
jgi:hypothetical protein